MSAKQDSAGERRYMPKLRASWVPMVLTVLVVVLVAMFGYFSLQYIRGTTFQEGRSFRVLRAVSRQFDNMQGSMSNLLTLVPESVFETPGSCKLAQPRVDTYLEKLDLANIDLESAEVPAKGSQAGYAFKLYLTNSNRPFTISRRVATSGTNCVLQITGNLRNHLPVFAGQVYFDQVLLALPQGTVLASIPNAPAGDLTVELQDDTADNALVFDARDLLAQAARAQAQSITSDEKDARPSAADRPQHAVAFRRSIGERTYEVFVLPIAPDNPIEVYGPDANVAPQKFSSLYLLGLKREDWAQQATDALGSTGAFAATVVVLIGVLLWPFLSLRLSPPDNAIAGFQVFAVIVSLVLLPVVLTVSTVWLWTQISLRNWADRGAEAYALQLDRRLMDELDQAAWLLRNYAALRVPPPPGITAPIRRDAQGTPVTTAIHAQDCNDGNAACRLFLSGRITPPETTLRNWSPLRTVVLLDSKGVSTPPRISAFGDVPVKTALDLKDRGYYQALRADQAWTPRWLPGNSNGLVAQRLFNRADAARVLQVAVPREFRDHWKGIATGDTRAYALTAGVRPPLLRFAVIARETGDVLFHTSDERSLTENLLVESERNPYLQQAMLARRSSRPPVELTDHFEGKYLGEPHRFYYRPITGIPWAVVVFYSTESLSDISFDAAIATLTHCISIVTILILAIVVVAFLWNRRIDRYLLAAIWPQWEWRWHYPRVALTLTAFWIVAVILLVATLRTGRSGLCFLLLLVAASLAGIVARSRWRVIRKPGIATYRLFYGWTLVAALATFIILPTFMLATRYQDVSMAEFMRAQLFEASLDLERRVMLMRRDLRRWVPNDRDRSRYYPSPDRLSVALPVPAYQAKGPPDCDLRACWTLDAFDRMPWINVSGPVEGGFYRRFIWRHISLSSSQHQRSTRRPSRVVSDVSEANTNSVVQFRRRDVRITAGAQNASQAVVRVEDCGRPTRAAEHCLSVGPDVIHRDRWGPINAAVLLAFVLLLLVAGLVAMTARRLFGIRIPFAPRFVDAPEKHLPFGPLLATEQRIDQARAEFGDDFTGKDATDIRRIQSGPYYREVWRSLSGDDRHLLHQLALGYFANPGNAVTIERLLHRGYIRLRPWAVITDPGLADFARTAPQHEEFRQDRLDWADADAHSTWHRIRIPLLSGGVMIAVGLMTFAGGTMQVILTSLAGISALLGHVTQVTNFVRKPDAGK